MRRSTLWFLLLILSVTGAGAGCDSGDPIDPTTPTTPTTRITETFAGSLTVSGAATFTFSATASGIVTATLRSVLPTNTVQLGIALGTWNGVTCQVVLSNDRATEGASVTGQVNAQGTLCARIYDVGQLAATTTFEIVVTHP